MAQDAFLTSPEWVAVRDLVRARDAGRCTVARLLGGECRGVLHVHHILPRVERPDLALDPDNCATTCASHHRVWESVRLFLLRSRRPLPPCKHTHRYAHAQRACDIRRARKLGIVLDDALAGVA